MPTQSIIQIPWPIVAALREVLAGERFEMAGPARWRLSRQQMQIVWTVLSRSATEGSGCKFPTPLERPGGAPLLQRSVPEREEPFVVCTSTVREACRL